MLQQRLGTPQNRLFPRLNLQRARVRRKAGRPRSKGFMERAEPPAHVTIPRERASDKALALVSIYASLWRIYRLPYRSEPDDNPGGEPKVILGPASELRHQIVCLNQPPMNAVDHLCIDATSQRQSEG